MNPMIGCNPIHGSLTGLHKDRRNGWCKKSYIRIRIRVRQFSLSSKKRPAGKGIEYMNPRPPLIKTSKDCLWSILSRVLKTKELVKEHNLDHGFCASSLTKKNLPRFITTLKNCTNKLVRISRWLWVLKALCYWLEASMLEGRVYECTYLRLALCHTNLQLGEEAIGPPTHVLELSSLSILIMSGKGVHGFVTIFFLQYQLWLGVNGHMCTSFQMTCPNSQDHDSEHDMRQVGINITPNTHEFSGLHQQCHNHSHVYPLYIYMCASIIQYIHMHVCTYLASRTRIFLTGPVLILGHEFTWGIIGVHRWSQIPCFPLLTTQSRIFLNRPAIREPQPELTSIHWHSMKDGWSVIKKQFSVRFQFPT
jgi:hypothetical protein